MTFAIEPYDELVILLNDAFRKVQNTDPTSRSEKEQERFIFAFREFLRILNKIDTYLQFDFGNEDILPSKNEYLEYQSHYKDLYQKKFKA